MLKNICVLFLLLFFLWLFPIVSFCGKQLYNVRAEQNRITKLNNKYRTEIDRSRNRITKLEAITQTDRRTIDQLTENQRNSKTAISRLKEFLKQQGNSVGTIETGNREIGDYLQKLRTIIINLPKSK